MRQLLIAAVAITAIGTSAVAQTPTAVGPATAMGLSQGTASTQLRARYLQPRNAAEYYGLPTAAQAPTSGPVRTASRIGTAVAAPAGKPFSYVDEGPTVSPYLNLYREQTEEGIPNYHAFVRPQQQQNEMNRLQARELSKLRRQVKQTQYASPVTSGVGGRFNNTGRFYQSWTR